MNNQKYQGFTLIEILVVVGLIAILAAVTIIAINPAKQFADTRDSTRRADINTIISAIGQYTAEDGNTLTTLTAGTNALPDCTTSTLPIGTDAANVDLSLELVEEYLVSIPTDPQNGTDADTGYDICQTAGGRVRITAAGENAGTITVTQ